MGVLAEIAEEERTVGAVPLLGEAVGGAGG